MNSPKLVVRRMAESELNLALEWAAAEGWNPGLHDAECFHAADPEGILPRRILRRRADRLHFRRCL